MKKIFLLLAVLVLVTNVYAQTPQQALTRDVNKMGTAFISGNWKTFVLYTYPYVVQVMGGAEKMTAYLQKTTKDMHDKGQVITKVSFGEPSAIIEAGKEWQATILEYMVMKISGSNYRITSTLIGISIDKGKSWKFIDASNKDVATLRTALPNLSPKLVIEKQNPPQKID